jgi:hypothetical protein
LRDERQAEDVVFLRFRCSNNPFLFSTTEAETQQSRQDLAIGTRSLIITTTTILTTNKGERERKKSTKKKKENNTTLLIISSVDLLVRLKGNFFIFEYSDKREEMAPEHTLYLVMT